MRKEHEHELKKIVRISNVLLPVLYLTLLSVAATFVVVTYLTLTSPTATGDAFFPSTWRLSVMPDQISAGLLTYRDKVALLSLAVVLVGLVVPGLWFAIQLIKCFKQNLLFSTQSVAYARRIAWLYSAYVVISSVATVVTSWTPEGFDVRLNPVFFSRDFILLGLIWLFVWTHQLGTAFYQDSEMTI